MHLLIQVTIFLLFSLEFILRGLCSCRLFNRQSQDLNVLHAKSCSLVFFLHYSSLEKKSTDINLWHFLQWVICCVLKSPLRLCCRKQIAGDKVNRLPATAVKTKPSYDRARPKYQRPVSAPSHRCFPHPPADSSLRPQTAIGYQNWARASVTGLPSPGEASGGNSARLDASSNQLFAASTLVQVISTMRRMTTCWHLRTCRSAFLLIPGFIIIFVDTWKEALRVSFLATYVCQRLFLVLMPILMYIAALVASVSFNVRFLTRSVNSSVETAAPPTKNISLNFL